MRRASPATRTATATAWSRSTASSRASRAQTSGAVGALVASFDAELARLEQRIGAAVARLRHAARAAGGARRARDAAAAGRAGRARGGVDAAAERAAHPRACAIRTTSRSSPKAPARRSRRAARSWWAMPPIERGGCRVESDIGRVDATLEDALGTGLRGARRRASRWTAIDPRAPTNRTIVTTSTSTAERRTSCPLEPLPAPTCASSRPRRCRCRPKARWSASPAWCWKPPACARRSARSAKCACRASRRCWPKSSASTATAPS